MEDLVHAGKIRHYGVSVEKVEEGLKALDYPGVVSVQIIYNIFRQRPANLFFREAKAKDVAVIVRVPLASGLLSGCDMFQRHSALECMERAMYFESNCSSRDGMVAVGIVVMNRVRSNQYPDSVCCVVGQRNQFADGVMTRRMDARSAPLVRSSAVSVLRGERHPLVGRAEFFHAASYRANYSNLHYVVTTGGNAVYEQRRPELVTQPTPLPAK